MVFLSIIIPVFNVEEYLDRCLTSIISQVKDGVEIILVDDGSKDKSGEICDAYSSKYFFIRTVHSENKGLSSARNIGIEMAKGKYLLFIDSDDYLVNNSLFDLMSIIKLGKYDVVVGRSFVLYDSGIIENETNDGMQIGEYSSAEYAKVLRKHKRSVSFCAQYHICKTEFIRNNALLFCDGLLHEDELWTPQVLLTARNVYYSGIFFYYHYMRIGSIMHSCNYEKRSDSLLVITTKLLSFFEESKRKDLQFFRDRLCNFFLQGACMSKGNRQYLSMRSIPLKNAYYFASRLKSIVYFISPALYFRLRLLFKGKNND